mmetsp:Transcript_39296/g.118196  ORF Transcript_39296/g.118196 Transcript_39296/m.118196 type:complete len:319 (-) Transcript_39296:225-1181(-)
MGGIKIGENHPPEFERQFPHFENFVEVAPGFWNYRTDFKLGPGNLLNIKTHMSIAQLDGGKGFVAVDAAKLTPAAKVELDELTQGGEKLVACMHTHPYHTLAIPAFHTAYPASPTRRYLGCPRHLKVVTKDTSGAAIEWSGDLNDSCVRDTFMPEIEMRVPAGSEFIDPQPPTSNHFSNVFVFHRASKTVVQDDTIVYVRKPQLLMRVFGFGPYSMHFHTSISGPGLYPTAEAPLQFMAWFQKMLDDWDFDHLISAHNGGCYGVAKANALALLVSNKSMLQALSERNAAAAVGKSVDAALTTDKPMGWSDDPNQSECG